MYNSISLCGYSLKMNMVLKIHGYEKGHFHCHKNRNLLNYGVLIRNASRYRTSGYDRGVSLHPVLTPAFLKALNNPYVKNNENKNESYPKRNSQCPQDCHKCPLGDSNPIDWTLFRHFNKRGNTSTFSIAFLTRHKIIRLNIPIDCTCQI